MNPNVCLGLLRPLRFCVWAFLISIFSLRLAGQNTVSVAADCVVNFQITAQGGTGPAFGAFDNRQIGCGSWQLQYSNSGFTAVTMTIQSSLDGVTFTTLAGTATYGTNPLTSTTAASALITSTGANFAPYVRVIATTATGTGTIRGVLLGYRALGTAGTAPAAPTGGVVVQTGCTLQQLFNLAASGNTRIINAGGTGTVRICEISFSTTAAEDIKLTEGTGTNCATGLADVTGLYKSVQSMVLDPQASAPIAAQTAGHDICLNQSAAQALGGLVVYAKF